MYPKVTVTYIIHSQLMEVKRKSSGIMIKVKGLRGTRCILA